GALREAVGVLPEQIARARVESLELVAERERENDTVVLERHGLVGPRRQRPRPRYAQLRRVARRDLRERAEAVRVVRAPPREPIGRRWIREQRLGDRRVAHERLGLVAGRLR